MAKKKQTKKNIKTFFFKKQKQNNPIIDAFVSLKDSTSSPFIPATHAQRLSKSKQRLVGYIIRINDADDDGSN